MGLLSVLGGAESAAKSDTATKNTLFPSAADAANGNAAGDVGLEFDAIIANKISELAALEENAAAQTATPLPSLVASFLQRLSIVVAGEDGTTDPSAAMAPETAIIPASSPLGELLQLIQSSLEQAQRAQATPGLSTDAAGAASDQPKLPLSLRQNLVEYLESPDAETLAAITQQLTELSTAQLDFLAGLVGAALPQQPIAQPAISNFSAIQGTGATIAAVPQIEIPAETAPAIPTALPPAPQASAETTVPLPGIPVAASPLPGTTTTPVLPTVNQETAKDSRPKTATGNTAVVAADTATALSTATGAGLTMPAVAGVNAADAQSTATADATAVTGNAATTEEPLPPALMAFARQHRSTNAAEENDTAQPLGTTADTRVEASENKPGTVPLAALNKNTPNTAPDLVAAKSATTARVDAFISPAAGFAGMAENFAAANDSLLASGENTADAPLSLENTGAAGNALRSVGDTSLEAMQNRHQAAAARHQAEPHHVREQVLIHIRKGMEDGQRQFLVQLDPADLGRVEIRMETLDGRVHVAITADSRETLEALQRDSRDLARSLNDLGLDVEQGAMEFNLREQTADGQSQREDNQHNTSENEAASASGTDLALSPLAQYETLIVTLDDGVNIRV